MFKSDIVDALCERGYYKNEASSVVDDVFDIISKALIRCEQVNIRGFGTFGVKVHKGRRSSNIRTGEIRMSNDRMIPVFNACRSLREAIRACPCSEN